METSVKQKWNQKPLYIILLLIFFFPIGIYFMWKNKVFSVKVRWIVSVFPVLFFILLMKLSDLDTIEKTEKFISESYWISDDIYGNDMKFMIKFFSDGTV